MLHISAFYGYSNNTLVYEESYKTWAIIDASANPVDFTIDPNNYNILAVLSANHSDSHVPTGLKPWDVFDLKCKGRRSLKFTSVSIFLILFASTNTKTCFASVWNINSLAMMEFVFQWS